MTNAERQLLLKVARRLLIHGCNTDTDGILALIEDVVAGGEVGGAAKARAIEEAEAPTKSSVSTGAEALRSIGRGSEAQT